MMNTRKAICFLLLAAPSLAGAPHALARPGRTDVLDPHALPLGDGKVSSEPMKGYVFSCTTRFRRGGARHAGNWIHGSSWDSTAKISVQGDVAWPQARFSVRISGDERLISGNGLPIDHSTGIFPVRPDDPAYRIDRNPNPILPQQVALSLPLDPRVAPEASCVPMGMIGVALSGVAIYNALDDAGRDAVAHEVQDHCDGHPEMRGRYHYHGPSPCLPGIDGRNTLVGYALDGFGITSLYDENGRELTDSDLDACHGRVGPIMWNGHRVRMYHYVMTREYPYTVGCFRGRPVALQMRQRAGRGRGGRGRRTRPFGGPPPEAVDACAGLAQGARCGFTTPRGRALSGICRAPGGTLACVPR